MEETTVSLTICAYLCHRDRNPYNGVDMFAGPSQKQLQAVKDAFDCKVVIFVAWDDPEGGQIWFAELQKESSPLLKNIHLPDRRIDTVFTAFLQWIADASNADTPRMLLYSGHGTPGYGLGRLSLSRSELVEIAAHKEMQPILDAFESRRRPAVGQKSQSSEKAARAVTDDELMALFPRGPEFEVLLSEGESTCIRSLSFLARLRDIPLYKQLGLNLISCGQDEDSALSIRQFRICLEKFKSKFQFDVILLQACSIGQVEVAYELRDACKSLIVNTTPFEGGVHLQDGLMATLKMLIDTTRPRRITFDLIASHQLIQAQIDFRIYANDTGIGFISLNPMSPGVLTDWGKINGFCEELFEILNNALSDVHKRASVIQRLNVIRGGFPRCEYSCEKEIFDLNEFFVAVFAAFPGECAAMVANNTLRSLVLAQTTLIRYSNATQAVKFSCSAAGMSLYFPRSKALLYDSYQYDENRAADAPENRNGFEWLKGNRWRQVLENFFA